jgi:hypothetical protein
VNFPRIAKLLDARSAILGQVFVEPFDFSVAALVRFG